MLAIVAFEAGSAGGAVATCMSGPGWLRLIGQENA
jgi:hypothetical protein